MKKFWIYLSFPILATFFSSLVQAQIDIGTPGVKNIENISGKSKSEIAFDNSQYVATINGYAKKCGVQDAQITLIKNQLIKNLAVVGIDENVKMKLMIVYDNVERKASNQNLTAQECENIRAVVGKIINNSK